METITICTLSANNNGQEVDGEVVRTDRGFAIRISGSTVGGSQRLESAIRELGSQIRRHLPRGRASSWGVAAHCVTGSFSFGYGNRRGGGSGNTPSQFSPCVQRAISHYPPEEGGLAAALEHAERTLVDCCR